MPPRNDEWRNPARSFPVRRAIPCRAQTARPAPGPPAYSPYTFSLRIAPSALRVSTMRGASAAI